ncbi:arginine--tRNA ligase [Salinisphaera sp. P385]|uniref:Arginine--tRNA ligase n=1 Tax=Spectribacter acetivorans TaxID=3075603 RepID=A0ABU3B6U6_9GAMM|nr:arginine--tRNA ligase [Salinisphaera sp. P385]MDT0618154.1 arginine--tRNA ligase [Salinisphaera sp. P385]
MKTLIQQMLAEATASALPDVTTPDAPHVERTRDPAHGDFASNIAMTLAKPARRAPRQIAEAIVAALPASERIAGVEIAGPGFINFRLAPAAFRQVVPDILAAGADYGRSDIGTGTRVMVEFVSANPTGPLHVGHGRGAAYGDCVARLLTAAGFDVHREYYVNDAGRQMDILAMSLWCRYLQCRGEEMPFPAGAYQGDYVQAAADKLAVEQGDAFRHPAAEVLAGLPADVDAGGDRDAYLDAIIVRARELVGEDGFRQLLAVILDEQLADIADDLAAFGVAFDRWFSERSLVDDGAVAAALERLREAGHTYDEEGATWFASSRFGDEKDRVLVRANGTHTYFAADIAYHLNKLDRGFDRLVDIWGADHHGYVPRVQAAVQALTGEADRLAVQLVQFAILYRGAEKLPMSTRAGQYVTLRELRDEVGMDATRFFYVMRSNEQHLDFDLELAKSQSNDNPVYYIQYAHARVCSVGRQLDERGLQFSAEAADLARLEEEHEQRLLTELSRYPEVVEAAALGYAPHTLAHYLREVADAFHSYYNAHPFLVEDAALRNARLALIQATRQVLANGLTLLGVTSPEVM